MTCYMIFLLVIAVYLVAGLILRSGCNCHEECCHFNVLYLWHTV